MTGELRKLVAQGERAEAEQKVCTSLEARLIFVEKMIKDIKESYEARLAALGEKYEELKEKYQAQEFALAELREEMEELKSWADRAHEQLEYLSYLSAKDDC
jgi:chromosome segregation ATPase